MVTGVISSQARVVAMVMPSNGADQQRTVVNGYLATTNQYYYTCIFDFSYMYPTNPSLDQVPESGLLGLLEQIFRRPMPFLSNQQRQSTEVHVAVTDKISLQKPSSLQSQNHAVMVKICT